MEEIILYTSNTCERCKLVKKMLDKHSVSYKEITNEQAPADLEIEQVPAIQIKDHIIDHYSGVLGWLQQNGYYDLEVIYSE